MTPLKKLRRILRVYGISEDLLVTISPEGIEFKPQGKGVRLSTSIAWPEVVKHSETPRTAMSHHVGRPMEFLQAQVDKQRSVKRRGVMR